MVAFVVQIALLYTLFPLTSIDLFYEATVRFATIVNRMNTPRYSYSSVLWFSHFPKQSHLLLQVHRFPFFRLFAKLGLIGATMLINIFN